MARKTTKICPLCGKEFQGTDGKITCSNACRTAAVRFRQKGKKMEFALLAKTKGQKLPSKKTTALKPVAPIIPSPIKTEVIPVQVPDVAPNASVKALEKPPMTHEQKWNHNMRIQKLITDQKNMRMPPGMFPRLWGLQQSDAIKELEKQLIP